MAITFNRLVSRSISTLKTRGLYADGAGLYLRVKHENARSWVLIYHTQGRRHEAGLGSFPSVGLADARERARIARQRIWQGDDPIAERRAKRQVPTFGEAADEFIKQRSKSVKSDKSIARWKRMIGKDGYAGRLRGLRVDVITTADVLDVLKPQWEERPSSAGPFRGYIEAVLNAAKVAGHRKGDNPAAWEGHLALILPRRKRLTRGHHAAVPFAEVPALMTKLSGQTNLSVRALEFTILTAARTSETLLATWTEFDLNAAVWTVPPDRMKAGKEHRVPLAPAVVELLKQLDRDESGLLFPGRSGKQPLSNMSMQMILRRMSIEATVHGFRSSFRDWAGEMTNASREVAEAALAHSVGNSAELAYRRGDALEKRRGLMEDWAKFCLS